MKLKIAGAQIPVLGDIATNFETLDYALDYSIDEKADILLTPEGSLSGYNHLFDQTQVDKILPKILEKARKNELGLALGTCFFEKSVKRPYNQIRFYDKNGDFLGFHSKILKTSGEMDSYESSPLRNFNFMNTKIGGLICNDLWANPGCTFIDDPHLTQKHEKLGTKILFHAVNGGRSSNVFMDVIRQYHGSNLQMRTQASKLWTVTVDNCFPFGVKCSAPSGVINPEGNWAIKTKLEGDQLFSYTIEL